MKKIIYLFTLLFAFSCSVDSIEENPSFDKGAFKPLELVSTSPFTNDAEFFESLEVVDAPKGKITHITWDSNATNGHYFWIQMLDGNGNLLVEYGTNQNRSSETPETSYFLRGLGLDANTDYIMLIRENNTTGEVLMKEVPIFIEANGNGGGNGNGNN